MSTSPGRTASLLGLLVSTLLMIAPAARAQVVDSELWVTDGQVHAVARDGNTLYVGGSFGHVGPATGSAVPFLATTAGLPAAFPKVIGDVYAVAWVGDGWIIGGRFTSVGGQFRNNLARVNSDFTVSSWSPNANGDVLVLTMPLFSTSLYVGGAFTSINGSTRNRLALFDVSTGVLGAWNPSVTGPLNAQVNALAPFTSQLIIGGTFTTVNGVARQNLAGVDQVSGALTSFIADTNGAVRVLTFVSRFIDGVGFFHSVYVGGDFTSCDGFTRNRIAELNSSATLTAWNPNANGAVHAITSAFGLIYVGGDFVTIGGQARNRIALIDPNTTAIHAWNPNSNGRVSSIVVDLTVHVGGDFTSIGGQSRRSLAEIDGNGVATAWNPNVVGVVRGISRSNPWIFAVGNFHCAGPQVLPRTNLAAFDLATGEATSWNPDPNGTVEALALRTNGGVVDAVYAGGTFTHIGGQARQRIAALDPTTASAHAFNPSASGPVYTLTLAGSVLYAGGVFSTIGGQSRSCFAELDAVTGAATALSHQFDGAIHAIAVNAGTIYAGGFFSFVDGIPRKSLVAFDATGLLSWNPNFDANGFVFDLAVRGSNLLVAGEFESIGPAARLNLGEVSLSTPATVTPWNPWTNAPVLCLAVDGSMIYAGGDFSLIGGLSRSRLAAIDTSTGLVTDWIATADGGVFAIAVQGPQVCAGGDFRAVGGKPQASLALVEGSNVQTCSNAGPPSESWGVCGTTVGNAPWAAIPDVALNESDGGAFTAWRNSNGFVRVNRLLPDGTLAPGWPLNGVAVYSGSTLFSVYLEVLSDGSDGVFVVWDVKSAQQGDIYCQRLTGAGLPATGWPAQGVLVDTKLFATFDAHERTLKPRAGGDRIADEEEGGSSAVSDGAGGIYVEGYDSIHRLDSNGSRAPGWALDGLALPPSTWLVTDGVGGVLALSGDVNLVLRRVLPGGSFAWQVAMPIQSNYSLIVSDRAGGAHVVIEDFSSQNLVAFHLDSGGAFDPDWPVGGALIAADPGHILLDVSGDGAGGLLAVFRRTNGGYAVQRLAPNGLLGNGWPANGFVCGPASQTQYGLRAVPDGNQGALVFWTGRTGTAPNDVWATRICANGAPAPGWTANGDLICTNLLYTGMLMEAVSDGARGAYLHFFRNGAGNNGTLQALRVGADGPPSVTGVPVVAGTPSVATAGAATVTFQTVTAGGQLYAALTTGPPLPDGQQSVPAASPAVHEIGTSATYTGTIDVCITYDPAQVSGSESALRILHHETSPGTSSWVDITTGIDVQANRICGRTTSLSPFAITETATTDTPAPRATLRLAQNVPNPFNPTTTIEFELPLRAAARLRVFDVRGRVVRSLVQGQQEAGLHRIVWFGDDERGAPVGSGVYFYRLETPERTLSRRMVLVR